MKRLCVFAFVLASLGAHAQAARPTAGVKLRRAVAVAVVGGALATGAVHAADLKSTIDEVVRPAYVPGMVIPKNFAAISSMKLAPSVMPSTRDTSTRFELSVSSGAITTQAPTSMGVIASNLLLGGAHRAAQEWYDDSTSTLAKTALFVTDPSHFNVKGKLRPMSIAIQYQARIE